LEIQPEVRFFVVTDQVNTPNLIAGKVSGQFGHRLLTRTTKSDKKSRSLRHSDNSVDFNDVFDALIEKYKRHRLVFKVILF
jgi:hypothetical protein